MSKVLLWSLFLVACLAVGPVLAQVLDVVSDHHPSVPAAPYFRAFVAEPSHPAVMDGVQFPLRTTLRSAVLPTQGVSVFKPQWLTSPVFVLGTDPVSQRWLSLNLRALLSMGAMGLVVQADSPEAFKNLQVLGDGLSLVPTRSPWLEKQLLTAQADVYPLLIQLDGTALQIVPQPESGSTPQTTRERLP
jgi:integrating conjugative element protein (TIGR03765 family)